MQSLYLTYAFSLIPRDGRDRYNYQRSLMITDMIYSTKDASFRQNEGFIGL